jgi:hypothetical protein
METMVAMAEKETALYRRWRELWHVAKESGTPADRGAATHAHRIFLHYRKHRLAAGGVTIPFYDERTQAAYEKRRGQQAAAVKRYQSRKAERRAERNELFEVVQGRPYDEARDGWMKAQAGRPRSLHRIIMDMRLRGDFP